MRTHLLVVVAATLLVLGCRAGEPEVQPVKAELFKARGGMNNIFAKIAAGQANIAYFGGSITAASGWRVNTFKWFKDTYPQTKFTEINATIGGTGSDLGVFRFQQDVLRHKPDMIFVEFAVNDNGGGAQQVYRSMEGIVRQAWASDPNIDLFFVYTLHTCMRPEFEKGICPRAMSVHDYIAEHYGIPAVNVALKIVDLAKDGKVIYKAEKDAEGKDKPLPEGAILFSNDECHPTPKAHEVYTELVIDCIKKMAPNAKPAPHELKTAINPDNWEKAKLVPLTTPMVTPGWKKLEPTANLAKAFGSRLPEIWEATKPGEKITFKFKGSRASLYDLVGPDGGQAIVTVDGKAGKPVPRFDRYCTYHRLASLFLADNLPNEVHTVTVEIHPDQPNRSSVVDIEKTKPKFDPKRYDGTAMRVGSIMVLGDVVE
ncbi:MAG TPA: SGNH/GDSL hydrolase family protein [Planctomycetota bacterium]|jgi:lysophospholipase L1-like esterase